MMKSVNVWPDVSTLNVIEGNAEFVKSGEFVITAGHDTVDAAANTALVALVMSQTNTLNNGTLNMTHCLGPG